MSRKPPTRKKRRCQPQKATDAAIKTALRKHDGLFSPAAASLGMSRQGLHERVNTTPELFELAQELRTGHGDLAESVLTYRMRRFKDREAAKFVLVSRFKDRGYGPQPEIEPPPPDTSRRSQIIAILVAGLDRQAAAMHEQPPMVDVTPKGGALNGHTPPRPNGVHHPGQPTPAQQLLAAKKNGKA